MDDEFSDSLYSNEGSEGPELPTKAIEPQDKVSKGSDLLDEWQLAFHSWATQPFLPKENKTFRNAEGQNVLECTGGMDIRPDLCHLNVPPVPITWPGPDDEDVVKLTHEMAAYNHWAQCIISSRTSSWKSRKDWTQLKDACLEGNFFSWRSENGRKMRGNKARFKINRMHLMLPLHPRGKESRNTSSCAKTFNRDGKPHLAVIKGNAIQIRAIEATNDRNFLRYSLARNSDTELVNYELPLKENIFGFSMTRDATLFATRQAKSFSLLGFDGDIVSTQQQKRELLDLNMLQWQDSLAVLDDKGTISFSSLETSQIISMWEEVVSSQVHPFDWAIIDEDHSSTSNLKVTTRREVSLFDIRDGRHSSTLFEPSSTRPNGVEIVTSVCSSKQNQNSSFVMTDGSINILDHRKPKNVVKSWRMYDHDLTTCCETILMNDIEYVISAKEGGGLVNLALDWKHSRCHNVELEEPNLILSCQSEAEMPQTPVQRGRLVELDGIKCFQREVYCEKSFIKNLAMMPINGLATYVGSPGSVSLFVSNMCGVVFGSEVTQSPEATGELTRSSGSSFSWLRNEVDQAVAKACQEKTQEFCDTFQVPKYARKLEVTQMFNTNIMNKSQGLLPVKKEARFFATNKKAQRHLEEFSKERKRLKRLDNLPTLRRACPKFPVLDPSKHVDSQGIRVCQILNGENPFAELDVTTTSSRTSNVSSAMSDISGFSMSGDESWLTPNEVSDASGLETMPSTQDSQWNIFDPLATSTQEPTTDTNLLPLTAANLEAMTPKKKSKSVSKKSRKSTGF